MADSGQINLGPVPIEQLFTAGNILEDSYKLEYKRRTQAFQGSYALQQKPKTSCLKKKLLKTTTG